MPRRVSAADAARTPHVHFPHPAGSDDSEGECHCFVRLIRAKERGDLAEARRRQRELRRRWGISICFASELPHRKGVGR